MLCDIEHRCKYVACAVGVAYEFPLSRGIIYVRQVGTCVNDSAREHCLFLRNGRSRHLAFHCNECDSTLQFNTRVSQMKPLNYFCSTFIEQKSYYIFLT